MTLADRLSWVMTVLRQGRVRSLLTLIGIAIGIAAVALLTAIGEGVRHYVLGEFSQFGTRLIAVNPGKTMTGGMGGLLSSVRPLTLDDAAALQTLPGLQRVVPVVQGVGSVEWNGRTRDVDVFGVNQDMPEAWRFQIALGHFLPDTRAGSRSSPHAVLGDKVRRELFGDVSPLGQFVRLGGMRFRIVGAVAPKGDMLGIDLDDIVYIPADLALELFNREGLMEINMLVAETAEPEDVIERVRQRLMERHGREDFTLTTQDQMLASLDNILGVMTLAVALLGSISLLVGAVGIVTTQTTSMQERRSEIGLLRALGATRGMILRLFLWEAVVLAVSGGLLGLLLMGLVMSMVLVAWPSFPLSLHAGFLALSLVVAAVIGLLAGAIPAWRASSLDPVEALRAE